MTAPAKPGTGAGLFPETAWSLILRLKETSPEERVRHLGRLIGLYWRPVCCVIRHARAAASEDDARDLTQEFFLSAVIEGDLVSRFAPERGSFRAFLRGAIANFVRHELRDARRLKRGGGAVMVSLEGGTPSLLDLVPDAPHLTAEQVFDAAWSKTVFLRALDLLKHKLEAEGKGAHWGVFERYTLAPAGPETSYEEVGQAFGMSRHQVRHALVEARAALRDITAEIVRGYVDGPDELARELELLLGK